MDHKIIFWKPDISGVAGIESLFFYAVLVAEVPFAWKQRKSKVVSILPLSEDAPRPDQLIIFVDATDNLAAFNEAKSILAALPALSGHQVKVSWLTN